MANIGCDGACFLLPLSSVRHIRPDTPSATTLAEERRASFALKLPPVRKASVTGSGNVCRVCHGVPGQ